MEMPEKINTLPGISKLNITGEKMKEGWNWKRKQDDELCRQNIRKTLERELVTCSTASRHL